MQIEIKPEEEKDYRITENLTREAFWNLHLPGCDEHFLLHNLRKAKEFAEELDFVAVADGEIVGNIVYVNTKIINGSIEHPVLTFGPVSVLPEYQGKGIGKQLINHTIRLAKEMGHKAIVIYGDPDYYKKFGFTASKKYNITNSENKFPAALLVLELFPNALAGIEGVFDEGEAYKVDLNALEAFEKGFGKKEKGYSVTQERFKETSNKFL